jgi:hypothetical protein
MIKRLIPPKNDPQEDSLLKSSSTIKEMLLKVDKLAKGDPSLAETVFKELNEVLERYIPFTEWKAMLFSCAIILTIYITALERMNAVAWVEPGFDLESRIEEAPYSWPWKSEGKESTTHSRSYWGVRKTTGPNSGWKGYTQVWMGPLRLNTGETGWDWI